MSTAQSMMQVIQSTPAVQIPELQLVRDRYIQNYNATHKDKSGELMYHRQLIFFRQIIVANVALQSCDPFSLYACIATAAVKGYSFDPGDNEVYMIARAGKACLDIQAGAYVRRLITTDQCKYAQQAVIVYDGDTFDVSKGMVIDHVRKHKSDKMFAAFVVFILDEKGTERHFIYYREDWETWRSKSSMSNGANWNTNNNPLPGFLRTKVVKHAATEKCWATGSTPANVEVYQEVEVDTEDIQHVEVTQQMRPAIQQAPVQQFSGNGITKEQGEAQIAGDTSDNFNSAPVQHQNSVNHTDDDF